MTTYSNPGAIADVVGTTGRIEATWGNAIRDRVINCFASTAARDAAILFPSEGALCYVTADDVYYYYSGAAWIQVGPFGAWTSYTPGLTQSAAVTKTVTYARYQKLGRTVTGSFILSVTGSGAPNAAIIIGVPVTAATTGTDLPVGVGQLVDASAALVYPGEILMNTTTTFTIEDTTTVNATYLGATGAVFAGALASGDVIRGTFCYEAAA